MCQEQTPRIPYQKEKTIEFSVHNCSEMCEEIRDITYKHNKAREAFGNDKNNERFTSELKLDI